MRSRIVILAVGLLLLAGTVAAVGDAKPTLLGAKEVSFRVDRDELLVGLRDGTFSKLLFEVQDNDLEMFRVVVTYGNGATDTIPVRHLFRKGSRSRLIDLPGGRRIIRKIVFFYKTVGPAREGRAQVRVYGLDK
jgi:hypothetical protein